MILPYFSPMLFTHHFFSLFLCVSLNLCMCNAKMVFTHRAESNRHVQWFSESDVSDINEADESRTASPPTILEAVDGVQPELQHTQKESELFSKSPATTTTKNKNNHQPFLLAPINFSFC